MRLSQKALATLPSTLTLPQYNRTDIPIGIVHFGIGAFHRAHQAYYTDMCLNAGQTGWGICGVSMRSDTVARQLEPQNGLYTLTERSGDRTACRVIGAVREVLVAALDPSAIITRLAAPDCHIVSFTVTEKGYCRKADGTLDLNSAASGFYPILAKALERRKEKGLPGLTLLSCDNLSGNGRIIHALFTQWLEYSSPDLCAWFVDQCTTPDTMVDRIVPATSGSDLDGLEDVLGLRDEGGVFTEPFTQWVIEDRFAGPHPNWHKFGAQIVSDVGPYETAKLRMLNGAHSLLAYCGLDAGHVYVHQAIADPQLRALTDRLMREEAVPTINAGAHQDLLAYADALISRFANPALNHQLLQIAMDGSQKIPQRWLETLASQQQSNKQCPAILAAIAAWLRHVKGNVRIVDDPMAEQLRAIWETSNDKDIVEAIFGNNGVLASDWLPTKEDRKIISNLLGQNADAL